MYGPQVGRLGGGREADLAVVGRVLEDLAEDDPDVLVAERRDARRVLVAVGHQLEQAGRDARLDDADAHAVAVGDEPVALGRQLDRVARVDLGELARVGEVGQEGEAGLAGLLDEDADRGLAALLGRDGLLAGGDQEHLEPVDVALGDPVGRVEREGGLVVLAGGAAARPAPRATWPAGSPTRRRARARAAGGSSRRPRPTGRPSPGRSPGRPAAASGGSG